MNSTKPISQLFIGYEAEGPERKLLTLFIPKNAKNRYFFLEAAKRAQISRLYFGAGNDRGIHEDLIEFLKEIPDNFSTFLEISSASQINTLPLAFLKRTNIIHVWSVQNLKIMPTSYKIETETDVHWFTLPYPVSNTLNDKLYKEDFLI